MITEMEEDGGVGSLSEKSRGEASQRPRSWGGTAGSWGSVSIVHDGKCDSNGRRHGEKKDLTANGLTPMEIGVGRS